MILGPKDPGPWQLYLQKNQHLPLNEVTHRYMMEQIAYQAFLKQHIVNTTSGGKSAGVNAPSASPSPQVGNFLLTEGGDTITDEGGNPIVLD